MHIRSKAYLHLITVWRLLRDAIPPHHDRVPAEASRPLLFAAIVLALILVILEVDAHRGKLVSLALVGNQSPVQSVFLSP